MVYSHPLKKKKKKFKGPVVHYVCCPKKLYFFQDCPSRNILWKSFTFWIRDEQNNFATWKSTKHQIFTKSNEKLTLRSRHGQENKQQILQCRFFTIHPSFGSETRNKTTKIVNRHSIIIESWSVNKLKVKATKTTNKFN